MITHEFRGEESLTSIVVNDEHGNPDLTIYITKDDDEVTVSVSNNRVCERHVAIVGQEGTRKVAYDEADGDEDIPDE